VSTRIIAPSQSDLEQVFEAKYAAAGPHDWGPGLRRMFRYFNPDEWYEAVVEGQVTPHTRWLDIGCGRDLFPSNRGLAARLSSECSLLVGVDQDDTVHENPFLHNSVNSSIETYEGEAEFDLITLRMVAEHIADPESAIPAIAKLAQSGGRIII